MDTATETPILRLSCRLHSAQDLVDLAVKCEKAFNTLPSHLGETQQILFQSNLAEKKTNLATSSFLQFLLGAKERTQHMWGKYQQSQNFQRLGIVEKLSTSTQIKTEPFPHYQRRLFSQTEQFMEFEHCVPKDKLYTGFVKRTGTSCHIESYAYYELKMFDTQRDSSAPLWHLLLELHNSQTYPQHMWGLIVRPHTHSEVREAYSISTRLQTLGQQALESLR